MEEFLISKIHEIAFAKVGKNDPLWSSRILDSITIVELAVEIENEYGIKVPFNEITVEHFETVELITQYIAAKK
ncbi:MAG: acyl carrier protein [Flavobacteriales bacterium]